MHNLRLAGTRVLKNVDLDLCFTLPHPILTEY